MTMLWAEVRAALDALLTQGNALLCTKHALLKQRLPEPDLDQAAVQAELEGAPRALRAIPKCVAQWTECASHGLVETAIQQHVNDADYSNASFNVFHLGRAALRAEDESKVVAALKCEAISRLNKMLDKGVSWKQENSMRTFEPVLASMLQPAAAGTTAAVEQQAPLSGAASDVAASAAAHQAGAGASLGGHAGGPACHTFAPSLAGSDAAAAGASAQMQVEGATATRRGGAKRKTRPPDRLMDRLDTTSSSHGSYLRPDFALVVEEAAVEQLSQRQEQEQQHQQQVREHMGSCASASTSACSFGDQRLEWQRAARKYVAVAEVKRHGKLFEDGQPLQLVDLWSQACDDDRSGSVPATAVSVWHIINQLFTYMVLSGVQYGWLSCYCATWLAWRPLDQPDCLLLSRPFLHDVADSRNCGAVTTMAALSWLQHAAFTAWKEDQRHQLNTYLFAGSDDDELPEPDAGDAEDDPKDHDYVPKSSNSQSKRPLVRHLPVGTVQLNAEISQGVSAVVFRGWYLGVEAAIKMVFCDDALAVVRHEAAAYQALSAAQDAGAIPTMLGVGRLALGTPFIAMSLVAGAPLSELRCITPDVRVAAVAALRQIHAAGVAHGDLRGSNIMVEWLSRRAASGGAGAGAGVSQCEAQSEGRLSPGSGGVMAGRVRVVIVDFGLAHINASRAMLKAEERYLQCLLR